VNSYSHETFSADSDEWAGRPSISVCVPVREEARTIVPIVSQLTALRDAGAIDEVVVVDGASADGTAELAADAGATVHQQASLRAELGPVLGKGDAMWRALTVLGGDIVCFLDGDTERFGAHFALGLAGPLVRDPSLHFVKGHYRRPFKVGGIELADGGGRVTELTARPLLARFYPELGTVRQPLAGELAARRELLEQLPFFTGYGVEIGLLIDAYRAVGLDGLGQVDLGVRQNRHQPLHDLGPMAAAVLEAVARRLEDEGRLRDPGPGLSLPPETWLVERPPLASLSATGPALVAAPPAGADRLARGRSR
jgi:glucosyl-3-phosphoglycerate synthase